MDNLEFTAPQKLIAEFILHTPAPGKHCARSAISHIQSAWAIRKIDLEMAAFRSLTAVEEATTAIFHSLKRHKYEGADKLQLRSHVHKAAVSPFLGAIETNFAKSKLEPFHPTLELRGTGANGKVMLRLEVPDGPDWAKYAYPQPPLNFTFKINGERYHFTEELERIVSTHNSVSILKHVKDLASRRNRLLYASAEGVPKVKELGDGFLLKKRDVVFQHLCIYLMIDPYPQKQLFVQQTLESFLKMLNLLPDDASIENE
jgi:hypothetical protein